jgi:ribonuclease R
MNITNFTNASLIEANNYINHDLEISTREIVSGITIDSETSQDLDDGLEIFKRNGNYVLQVSIADVSDAVSINSELFRIAFQRLETRYLKFSRIPMLPVILSENKLSLLEGSTRAALTFEMEIDKNLELIDLKIKETIFKNLKKYSYSEFENLKNLEDKSSDIYIRYELMSELALKLLESRRQKGALAIYDIIHGIYTDEEGNIREIDKNKRNISYLIVLEFMIFANKSVAWHYAQLDYPILNRNHTVKLNAPQRSEILEQINTVVHNPEHLESFVKRNTLWFNKASYGTEVKGHFGLNEPVYCHVTSPIRRIADLINHIQIKSYLKKLEPVFSINQLQEFALLINEGIEEIKDEKNEILKQKLINSGSKKIINLSENKILEQSDSEFNNLIYAAVKSETMNNKMKNIIEDKIRKNELNINQLYNLLFKNQSKNQIWNELREFCLNYIKNQPGMSLSLMNILVPKGNLDQLNYDVNYSDGLYFAKIQAMKSDKSYIIKYYCASQKKKDAISLAAHQTLRIILNLPEEDSVNINQSAEKLIENTVNLATDNKMNDLKDDKSIEIIEIKQDNTIQKSENIDEKINNYVGILLEFQQKNPDVKISDYDMSMSGSSHSPIITCCVRLEVNNIIFEGKSEAGNKKTAKQEAAKDIYQQIIDAGLFNIKENDTDNFEINNSNPISALQEFLVKSKNPLPEYSFTNVGNINKPQFECVLKIEIDDKSYTFKDIGENKKVAKNKVAAKCLNSIKLSDR